MAKFQLTLSPEYVKDWALWEGIREVIQNAIDGATDGYQMDVSYDRPAQTLRVTSHGAKLDRSVWLMGVTTKADSLSHIGHFGEGLKLGALALVRAGHGVSIRNDDETWAPSLEDSEAFPGQRVLTIRTRVASPTSRFTISVTGVEPAGWESIRDRFLCLNSRFNAAATDSDDRTMRLDDPAFRGMLFVKGIYVDHNKELTYGYNFISGVNTDRDRKMVAGYQVDWATASYWSTRAGTDQQPKLIELLEQGAADIKSFYDWSSHDARQDIHAAFLEKHGEKAYPCTSLLEAQKLEHYGYKPVVVNAPYFRVFERLGITLEAANKAHANDIQQIYPLDSLNRIELAIYSQAIELVSDACRAEGLPEPRNITQVGRFADPTTLGMFDPGKNGKAVITINRSVLSSLPKTLQVLVHEVAHHVGGDGDVAHERMEGRIFSAMVCSALAA